AGDAARAPYATARVLPAGRARTVVRVAPGRCHAILWRPPLAGADAGAVAPPARGRCGGGMTAARRATVARWVEPALHRGRLLQPLAAAVGYARRRPAFPILNYHRVNDDGDAFFPAVPTAVFERHVAYLARAYRVMTVEELVERCR